METPFLCIISILSYHADMKIARSLSSLSKNFVLCSDFAEHGRPKVPMRDFLPLGEKERHAKRAFRAQSAQSPAAFCLRQNRQDRRTAVRRVKFFVKVQLCRTFTPLPAPYPRAPSLAPKGQFTLRRRGLVRCADERGLSLPVSPEPGAYLRGTASPLEEHDGVPLRRGR